MAQPPKMLVHIHLPLKALERPSAGGLRFWELVASGRWLAEDVPTWSLIAALKNLPGRCGSERRRRKPKFWGKNGKTGERKTLIGTCQRPIFTHSKFKSLIHAPGAGAVVLTPPPPLSEPIPNPC